MLSLEVFSCILRRETVCDPLEVADTKFNRSESFGGLVECERNFRESEGYFEAHVTAVLVTLLDNSELRILAEAASRYVLAMALRVPDAESIKSISEVSWRKAIARSFPIVDALLKSHVFLRCRRESPEMVEFVNSAVDMYLGRCRTSIPNTPRESSRSISPRPVGPPCAEPRWGKEASDSVVNVNCTLERFTTFHSQEL